VLLQVNFSVHPNEWEIILPENKTERVILTTCSTGIGTAVKIRDLLEKSLSKEIYGRSFEDGLFVPMMPTISNSGKLSLIDSALRKRELTKDMLSYVNHELIRNFSLDRVIQSVTILDIYGRSFEDGLFVPMMPTISNSGKLSLIDSALRNCCRHHRYKQPVFK
jgi:sigma-54 dependent transcriptional regulator of gfr operon